MAQSEIRLINTIEELKLYKEEWQNLLMKNENNNPFLEFDWIESWWTYFGKDKELFVLLIKEKDMVLGFFPLMITNRIFYKEITFVSSYIDASYMDFILNKEESENCINLAFDYIKNLKGNYIIKLFGFYEESNNAQLLKMYLINKEINFQIISFNSPFIKIDKDYETYFKERSKYSSLKTLKRSRKKLESSGNITFKKLEPNQFERMYQLHEKRWRKKLDVSNLTEKQHQDFYKNLALNDNLSFQAHADGLMIGEKLIGFTYGIECNGKFIYYRVAHDDDFSVYGPGKIVLEEMLKKCFNNHMDSIDLGIGYARYKYEWTDSDGIVKEFVIASDSIIVKFICLKYKIKKKIIAFMKKFKWYYSFKIFTLGKVKYLLTGGYIKDIITAFKRLKDDKQIVKISVKNLLDNIYSVGEYIIYDYLLYTDMKLKHTISNEQDNEVSNKDDKDNKDNKNNNNDIDNKYEIHEVNLNHIDYLCETMNKPVSDIVKRFYNNQRCFVFCNGSKEGYFWVTAKDFIIPAIKHEVKLDEKNKDKNAFILIEDTLSNNIFIKQTLSHISNVLQGSNYKKVLVVIKYKNEFLKDALVEMGYQPYQTIKYRKLFFMIYKKLLKQHN